jgi:general secretion pathway protein G
MTNIFKIRFQRGFTLIELVITVAIIGMLSSVALPVAELSVQRNKERELHLALREIRTALDAYKQAVSEGRIAHSMGDSGYPPSLKALTEGTPDITSPDKKKVIYFLRRIPRDPMFDDASKADEESWGKRSYASSGESPAEGDDVFDVYSQSAAVGLNGIPYRNW